MGFRYILLILLRACVATSSVPIRIPVCPGYNRSCLILWLGSECTRPMNGKLKFELSPEIKNDVDSIASMSSQLSAKDGHVLEGLPRSTYYFPEEPLVEGCVLITVQWSRDRQNRNVSRNIARSIILDSWTIVGSTVMV